MATQLKLAENDQQVSEGECTDGCSVCESSFTCHPALFVVLFSDDKFKIVCFDCLDDLLADEAFDRLGMAHYV